MKLGSIEITEGNVSPYIGHDWLFKPCLYFLPTHRQRATLALANYLSKEAFDAHLKIAGFMTSNQFEDINNKIHKEYLEKAIAYVNSEERPLPKIGKYYFSYLPKWKS